MKVLLCVLFLASFCGKTIKADEVQDAELKSENDITSSTKKMLRKVGRKSMDGTCELTKSKEECNKLKLQKQKGAEADQADTDRRQADKVANEAAKNEAKAHIIAKQKTEEKNCHEVNGKIQCAGKKIKNKVQNIVQ